MQPVHPAPRQSHSPQPPESYRTRTYLQAPRGGPCLPPKAEGHASRGGQLLHSMRPLCEPGPPLVSGAGRRSALGPQLARGASRALPVLAWAFPRSPHPLDISTNQSTWRSARRRPPAVQSAPQVQPLLQDSASESNMPLLAEDAQAGLGRGGGGGERRAEGTGPAAYQQRCSGAQPATSRSYSRCRKRPGTTQTRLQVTRVAVLSLPWRALTLNSLARNDSRRLFAKHPAKGRGSCCPARNECLAGCGC